MKISWWLRVYVGLYVFVLITASVVFFRHCGSFRSGGLTLGCSNNSTFSDLAELAPWMLITSTTAVVVGSVITLSMRRRLSAASFIIWASVGLLWIFVFAPDQLSTSIPEVPLFLLVALVGIPAGVSMTSSRKTSSEIAADAG